ncbi:MAG: RcnB family protein [Proteobacteria bacterium]|nr:RcnB family protein [Pseudomonadota bacterium]
MRKTFLLGLMAAVTIVPAMASAQDRDSWRGRRGGDSSATQPQGNNGGWRGNGGGWRGRGDAASTPAPTPAPAPAPSARGDGNRFGGWAGRDRGNDGWAGRNGGSGDGANDQARRRPGGNRWNGNSDNDGNRFRGWAGGNGGGVTPDANDQARAQAEARARADRNRSWSGNNWRGDRNNGWNGGNRSGNGGDSRWRGNDGNRGDNWNRGWRGNDRYNWQRYRNDNRNLFRLPRYYAPYGWSYGYRRFSIGFVLDRMLFGQNYWIDDPYEYRLPEAYGEYRWVRYYNDALLVDIYTGEVVDVVYDIFY